MQPPVDYLNKYYPGRHPCQALSDSTPAKEDGGRLKVERQPDSLLPSFFILHPSAFILLRSSFILIPHPCLNALGRQGLMLRHCSTT
jgi:hypothetical protein